MATLQPDSEPTENPAPQTSQAASQNKTSPSDWQERLLPLMTRLLVFLAIFFFIATFLQLSYLYWNITRVPDVVLNAPSGSVPFTAANTNDQMAIRKLEYSASLEGYVVSRRYHQAAMSTASNLWLRYLGFVTGMILALVGASFILGKLQEPISEIQGKLSAMDFSLRSASPGIILAVLGVILMYATIVDVDVVDVKDNAVYFTNVVAITTPVSTFAAPTLPLIPTPTPYVTPIVLGK